MKYILYFFCIILTLGCAKQAAEPTKIDMLARTWQVDEASGQSGTITVRVYKKGANTNLQDYSKLQVTFNRDGSMSTINQLGQVAKGSWRFLSNETQIELTEGSTITVVNVEVLSSLNFNYSVTTTNANNISTAVTLKMIPL